MAEAPFALQGFLCVARICNILETQTNVLLQYFTRIIIAEARTRFGAKTAGLNAVARFFRIGKISANFLVTRIDAFNNFFFDLYPISAFAHVGIFKQHFKKFGVSYIQQNHKIIGKIIFNPKRGFGVNNMSCSWRKIRGANNSGKFYAFI